MSVRVRRFDVGKITKAQRTPQGFLRVPIRATRVGIFEYRKADGSVFRELRLPEEVFKPDSMETLKGIPLTNEHPEGMLNPKNVSEHQVGYTGDVAEQDEEIYLSTVGTITVQSAIEDVEAGKLEVSCGYECELELNPGEWEGEPYDAIQRDIIYNHVAITDRGRAGPEVKIRLDSELNATIEKSPKEDAMKKIMIGGQEFEVSEELAAALEPVMAENEDMKAKVADMEGLKEEKASLDEDLEKMEAKADSLKSENRKLKKQIEERKDSVAPEVLQKAVKNRMNVVSVARKVCDSETVEKLDSMSDVEIKKAVIKTDDADIELDEKSDAYIDGRFDHIASSVKKESSADEGLGEEIINNRKDSNADEVDKARQERQKRDSERWKQPLSATKK